MTKNNKTKLLLSNIIISALDGAERIVNAHSLQQFFLYELEKMHKIKKQEQKEKLKAKRKFYNTLQYLKRAEIITQSHHQGKTFYQLTDKGKLKNALSKISHRQKGRKKAEKYHHLIIFDIPEKYRRVRALLRRNLYNLGYEKVQKSCFRSDNLEAYQLIKKIIKESGIGNHVKFFEIKKEI